MCRCRTGIWLKILQITWHRSLERSWAHLPKRMSSRKVVSSRLTSSSMPATISSRSVETGSGRPPWIQTTPPSISPKTNNTYFSRAIFASEDSTKMSKKKPLSPKLKKSMWMKAKMRSLCCKVVTTKLRRRTKKTSGTIRCTLCTINTTTLPECFSAQPPTKANPLKMKTFDKIFRDSILIRLSPWKNSPSLIT